MKLLQANTRKNRIIRELEEDVEYWQGLVKEISEIYSERDSKLRNEREGLMEQIKFFQTENEQLLEYKAKYYNLIKNL